MFIDLLRDIVHQLVDLSDLLIQKVPLLHPFQVNRLVQSITLKLQTDCL